MKLVKQPDGSGLCLAACVAMIVGCSLEYVLGRVKLSKGQLPNGEPLDWLPAREANKFLANHNYTYGMVVDMGLNDSLIVDGLKSVNAILVCKDSQYEEFAHAIIWDADEQQVLDPTEDKPQELDKYEIIEWIPVTYLAEDE